mgnify:CR=1 FL=1
MCIRDRLRYSETSINGYMAVNYGYYPEELDQGEEPPAEANIMAEEIGISYQSGTTFTDGGYKKGKEISFSQTRRFNIKDDMADFYNGAPHWPFGSAPDSPHGFPPQIGYATVYIDKVMYAKAFRVIETPNPPIIAIRRLIVY